MISGGDMRMEFSPEPRVSRPRWKALSMILSRRPGAFSLVFWSRTISAPIIRPFPRTSPTILKRLPVGDLAEDVAADFFGVGHQAAFDQVHGGQGRSYAHRIAAVGGPVRAGLPLHDAFFGDERADGHAAGNSLRGQDDVRRDPGMI